jgi:fibronectin type 3 domain-containing protein
VAAGRVQLSWRASPDRRIAGYRVYRTRADGAPVRLADLAAAARSYSDAARPKGEQPEYAVTAVDRDGRESLPARVTIAQPQSAEPGATP